MPVPGTPIRWDQDADGVVVLTLDDPTQAANTLNTGFRAALAATVDRLEAEVEGFRGVIITSAKKVFLAGGDLRELHRTTLNEVARTPEFGRVLKTQLRRLETLGRPVVAAIGGAALGGGLELALAAHHRIAVDDPAIQIGLPEVTLGLLPGGGGVVRTVRMLGVIAALDNVLLSGNRLDPRQAKALGLVDELVNAPHELLPAAKRWIAVNPVPVQPWDTPHYRLPGGEPAEPECAAALSALTANLRTRLDPANYPALHSILAVAVEGAQVDLDTAMEIERQHYIDLVTGPVAKNMIQAFFFDLRRVRGPRDRPAGLAPFVPDKVVVLGAGMMGAGIAYACARVGLSVVLADTTHELAQRGKDRCADVVADGAAKGRLTTEQGQQLLARITPTAELGDADGAQLLIEAVFEDAAAKAEVLARIEPYLAPGALMASNTSTLPISGLARHVRSPSTFIGLHFFSPVHKMPLIEVIKGEQTGVETLHRALDVARLLKKTAIVVNDSHGFFTSRVIRTFNDEGLRMLDEGLAPAVIEEACRQAGYPTPVLQLSDELNLHLMRRIRAAAGNDARTSAAVRVIDHMLDEHGRAGRQDGAGFYDYEDGRRVGLWPGLHGAFGADRSDIPPVDLKERLLFIEAIEAARCLDERVIESVADANVGSLLGIGYPHWTGGVLQYVNGYQGGPAGFVARAWYLAAAYGDRFEPPASLVAKAGCGEFYDDEPDSVERRDEQIRISVDD
jgi:3-hydroxyacyl-CoA dehydrogenase/enoyl-CoA hydratase/3-hydroxybutyryl-CoA epimerase